MNAQQKRISVASRTVVTQVWNVLGAVAGPLAAGIWFGDTVPGGARDGGPPYTGPEVLRGCVAAGVVALALTAFRPPTGKDTVASVRRGLAVGAASVGAAAGFLVSTTLGLFMVVGSTLGAGPDGGSIVRLLIGLPVGLALWVVGLLLTGRLWWLASRALKHENAPRVERTAAGVVAAATVAGLGGVGYLFSFFSLMVVLFVVRAHVTVGWAARPAGLAGSDEEQRGAA
jgi:hypothetical protein